MKSIIVFIDYFGKWPTWIDVFLASCAANSTINWCFHTDCPIPSDAPDNVTFVPISFRDYCDYVSKRLGVSFYPRSPYNICNLKPLFGFIHERLVEGYDFFGFGDLDVIYGDLRSIYDDKILSHNVISSHSGICSGHFALIRNERWLREAFRHLRGWEERLESQDEVQWHETLDEARFTAISNPHKHIRNTFARRFNTFAPEPGYYENNYFVEQWSTPFTPKPWIDGSANHPDVWYWRNGVLYNNKDGERTFLYLHFMNFKSKRWVNEELYGSAPTWESLPQCLTFDWELFQKADPAGRNLQIDRYGIHLML